MAFTKEYTATLTLSLDSVRKTERAQRVIYDSGLVSPNQNTLATGLSYSASILGIVFFLSTPASLAAGVVSLVSSLVENDKAVLQSMVYSGYWNLGYLEDFLVDNPNYDLIEVTLPFIEYETKGVRFITGKGVVNRVHSTSGGWTLL
ncbi:hypothetical protein D3C81_1520540 [compost metagenome]|nr:MULTISPECIES: hypothetical protein [Paenibacillus]MBY9081143.1 hypothetical protein [Paenibacillus sp. CGMCC 1.18879]MBY9087180.1 hypothetical protein [Paenibacillus sinensis]